MTSRPRPLQRLTGVTAAGALVLGAFAGVAGAQENDQDPPFDRGTSDVCDGDETHDFPDISGNVHEANIACMLEYGLTEGRDDGTYGPGIDVRRDQMASFIVRFVEDATGETLPAGDPDQFDDSDQFVNPHRENIGKLVAADIAEGDVQGNYNPLDPVQRQQMATFIRRALSFIDDETAQPATTPPPHVGDPIFADEPFVSAHRENINALAAVGIVQGDTQENYNPTLPVRRDQMASFVMRGYDYALSDEFPRDLPDDDADAATIGDARVAVDVFDEEGDTGTASTSDVWELTFTEEIDTDTGVTVTVEGDGETFVVECLAELAEPEGDNIAAACQAIGDDDTLAIALGEDLTLEDGTTIATYPLEITATTVTTADGEAIDLTADGADTTLDVDDDTEEDEGDFGFGDDNDDNGDNGLGDIADLLEPTS